MEAIRSVLIVDDDDDDVFLIQDRLDELVSSNCDYVSCSAKQNAIDYLKERTFDLCILDYRLAGFKGIEILEAVADAELATPIIMLTGQNDEEVAKQAIKLGAQDFVMKSLIDSNAFEKSIRYAVARKELEFAKILSQRNEAENVAKDKFIAHLSHELRTPLTSILGYTSMLLENNKTSDFSKELNIISKNGQHLLNLLNDVLDLSKIAAGKFELKEQEVDLQQVLSEINSLVLVTALDKDLSLEFSNVNQLPKSLILDDLRFKQVMLNLIGNAIKFTDSGGVKVSLEYKQDADSPTLEIRVADTGIGMKAQEIDKIFSPFKQIEDLANRKAGGAGLGLSISKEIVKRMGGDLQVSSVLGEGSEFTLHLPCQPSSDTLIDINLDLQQEPKDKQSTPQFSGKVLVVDDVYEIRELAGFYLRQTGLRVEFAKHGKQAIQRIQDAQNNDDTYDCVLMDLHMPVMTGKQAVSNIRGFLPNLPVVAMTAAISKGLKEELLKDGFHALVSKPLDKKDLWQVLSTLLQHSPLNTSVELAHNCAGFANNQASKINDSQQAWVHLIEDDADSAEVMKMMIESLGFSVLHSKTGKEAVANMSAKAARFHLLDLGLPDLQGENLLKAVTSEPHEGQIFILSGSQPDARLLDEYQIVAHLIKPINLEGLRALLLHNVLPQ